MMISERKTLRFPCLIQKYFRALRVNDDNYLVEVVYSCAVFPGQGVNVPDGRECGRVLGAQY